MGGGGEGDKFGKWDILFKNDDDLIDDDADLDAYF